MWAPLEAQLQPPSGGPGGWGGEHGPTGPQGWPGSAADLLQQQQSGGSPMGQGQGPSPAWPQAAGPGDLTGPQHTAASKIYVQGLPQTLQHPVAVAGLFSPFGDVLDVKLYAAEVRLSGGSAVVRMRSPTQAAAAIAALNGVVPEGGWQQLTVRAAETAEQRSSRITAINGRQGGGPLGSPLQPPVLPPVGPGALRRLHSSRGSAGSQGSLQCYTGGVLGGDPLQGRRSVDWATPTAASIDSSRRSSMDAARCRSSSDSGSEELHQLGAEGGALPQGELQRMLLEAVLALVGQVEAGQLTLPAMRTALETALAAAKQTAGGEEPLGRPNGFRAAAP